MPASPFLRRVATVAVGAPLLSGCGTRAGDAGIQAGVGGAATTATTAGRISSCSVWTAPP